MDNITNNNIPISTYGNDTLLLSHIDSIQATEEKHNKGATIAYILVGIIITLLILMYINGHHIYINQGGSI